MSEKQIGATPSFACRLDLALRRYETVLCIGIDPHPQLMPDVFGGPNQPAGDEKTLRNLRLFCESVIAAAAGCVPAIKPQVAFFEAHGPQGMAVLADISQLVIMDAKRGDIGTTAEAYASAWLGSDSFFAADALTVNPFLGYDSLVPFLRRADITGSGLFILTRTSNEGAADLQLRPCYSEYNKDKNNNMPLYLHLGHSLAPLIAKRDDDCGLSSIGIVVGAQGVNEATHLRKILPTAPFLIPGYGAQGAKASNALAGLAIDHNKDKQIYTGGLVNASRALTHASEIYQATTANAAIRAMKNRAEQLISDLQPCFTG